MANVLRQAENSVHIEGVLESHSIEEKVINGKEAISGELEIRTGENAVHTVKVFSYKFKDDGSDNGIYKGLHTVMTDYKSVAKVGAEDADKVRITSGTIGLNEYYGNDGQLKAYPQVNTNFVNRVQSTDEYTPKATFEVELFVQGIVEEMDKEQNPTGRLIIKGYVPVYDKEKGARVVPMQFIVQDTDEIKAVKYVQSNYQKNMTIKLYGDIINNVVITKKIEQVGFGKPVEKITKTTTRELVITGGSDPYVDEAKCYTVDIIKQAIAERETYLENLKKKAETNKGKGNSNNATGFGSKGGNNSKPKDSDEDLPF